MAAMKDRPEREDHIRQRIERGRFDARVPSRRDRAEDVANRKACRIHEGLGVGAWRQAPSRQGVARNAQHRHDAVAHC